MGYSIERKLFTHSGGTKSYELIAVTDGTQHVLIKRWGSNVIMSSGGGQLMVERYTSEPKLDNALASAAHDRKKRDYTIANVSTEDETLVRSNGTEAADYFRKRLKQSLFEEVCRHVLFDIATNEDSLDESDESDKSHVTDVKAPSYGDWGEF